MADFLNLSEADLIPWLQNWAAKLAVHEPNLAAITPADVAQGAADAAVVRDAVSSARSIRQDSKEYTRVKDELIYSARGTPLPSQPSATAWPAFSPGADAAILVRTRDLANRIKADADYTEATGQDLGIIGTREGRGDDPPKMSATSLAGFRIEVKWTRAGHGAVKIQGQRASEAVWEDLAVDTVSPYVDRRAPLVAGTPEQRRYRAAYLDDDVITTGWSATLVVTAQS